MILTKDFTIAKRFKGNVEALISKAQSRAAKFGGPIEITWGEEYRVRVESPVWYESDSWETFVNGTIAFPEMKLGDYYVIGAATKLQNHNILNGSDELSVYRHKHLNCEHCLKNITTRKHFVFVKHAETGHVVCVGKSCLSHYLGYDPTVAIGLVEHWGRVWEAIQEPDDYWDMEDKTRSLEVGTVTLATMTISMVRQFGFVSGRQARESGGHLQSTSDTIMDVLFHKGDKSFFENPTEEDKAGATAILTELEGIDGHACNEFDYKLHAIATVGYVPFDLFNTFVAGVATRWLKTLKTGFEPKKDYFGSPDRREQFQLVVTYTKEHTSTYTHDSYIMVRGYDKVSECGFIYMGNSNFAEAVEVGQDYIVKCKIKHDEHWKFGKTNKLDRPTIVIA